MFGKIKDKLKNVFSKTEEVIEEKIVEDVVDEEIPKPPKEVSEKKKDEEELKEIEEVMLEGVSEEEKNAICEDKDLDEESVKKNREDLEQQIKREEVLEKQVVSEIEREKAVEKEEVDGLAENDSKGFFSKTISKLKSKKVTEEDFDKIWVELEIFLLEINIAFEIVQKIEEQLREELVGNSFNRFKLSEKIRQVLEQQVSFVLKDREADLFEKIEEVREENEPVKIVILGVNGTGKTTTIAKIVNLFQKKGLSVVVAAADTFRAAATEQLEEHSKRLNFKLIKHRGGSDPAAVCFDAIEHAKAKKLDIVLIDTAGRMPNNLNLMNELLKIQRVSKSDLNIFIGDSISGNDLMEQIDLFNKGVGIDGVVLTKVDTDERPGSIVTTAFHIEKPIFYLGVGQEYDDLVKFDAEEIAKNLFEVNE